MRHGINRNRIQQRLLGRVVVFLFLFNILASVATAMASETEYTLLCTSQGLVKVALDAADDDFDGDMRGNACPYCHLFELVHKTDDTQLAYAVPSPNIVQHYMVPEACQQQPSVSIRIRPNRAPPRKYS
jgi:hypothetical protein